MSDEQTLSVYDAQAEQYADRFASSKPDASLRYFLSQMPQNARVLDFGCGPGNTAAIMRDTGLKVDAIDASAVMVKMAKDRYDIDAKQATFDQLDEENLYDGIWANFSLLHAPVADMPDNLRRIHHALKDGGLLHLGLKIGDGENRDHLGRRYSYFQPDELNQLLLDASFTPATQRLGKEAGLAGTIDPFMIVTANA